MKNKKNAIILGILIVFVSAFGTMSFILNKYHVGNEIDALADNNSGDLEIPSSSALGDRTFRVAIYDENNLTAPGYIDTPGTINNNATGLKEILESNGIEATLMGCNDIYDHKLKTADYDVLALVDNYPKDNITNYVMEFWLGGGGLLVFDGAAGFLCAMGILPPASLGDDGNGVYWGWSSSNINITVKHPVTKSFEIGDIISKPNGFLTWDWSAIQGTSIGSDLINLASDPSDPNLVTILAMDPTNRGGKIVTIAHDFTGGFFPSLYQIIIDSIDWLTPRPKGRILFDLSHNPYRSPDSWDTQSNDQDYGDWRNNLVNRSYTFDKLYPSSSGNLTSENIGNYDMLVLCWPDLDFTASEISAVTSWVDSGGGLFIMADYPSYGTGHRDDKVNELLASTDLSVYLGADGSGTVNEIIDHPTVEGCSSLDLGNKASINFTGVAYPIWGNGAGDYIICGQEFGNGRIILVGEMSFIRDYELGDSDNLQYAINTANWLTASKGEVILLCMESGSTDPNDNPYKSPTARALNYMGISFYLTFLPSYFNDSLTENNWILAVVDNTISNYYDYFDDLLNYMKNGGRLVLYTWGYYRSEGNNLFNYLGYDYAGIHTGNVPDIYIWDTSHSIFNTPDPYESLIISTTSDYYGTEFNNVSVFDNGTAISGSSITKNTENISAIIVGAEGRAISNIFCLTAMDEDTDNSGYEDSFEIWRNEIAFILQPGIPTITTNSQLISTGNITVDWTDIDIADEYNLYVNGVLNATSSSTSQEISLISNGTYEITVSASNLYGISDESDSLIIIVSIPSGGGNGEEGNFLSDLDLISILIGFLGGALVGVVLISLIKKKKA